MQPPGTVSTLTTQRLYWLDVGVLQALYDLAETDEVKDRLLTTVNNHGRTPLHSACRNGNVEAVKLLVKLGEDYYLDLRDNDGWVPIHLAAMYSHVEVVKAVYDLKIERTDEFNLTKNDLVDGMCSFHLVGEITSSVSPSLYLTPPRALVSSSCCSSVPLSYSSALDL